MLLCLQMMPRHDKHIRKHLGEGREAETEKGPVEGVCKVKGFQSVPKHDDTVHMQQCVTDDSLIWMPWLYGCGLGVVTVLVCCEWMIPLVLVG